MNLETSTPRRANRTAFATAGSTFSVNRLVNEIAARETARAPRYVRAANDIIEPSAGRRVA